MTLKNYRSQVQNTIILADLLYDGWPTIGWTYMFTKSLQVAILSSDLMFEDFFHYFSDVRFDFNCFFLDDNQ